MSTEGLLEELSDMLGPRLVRDMPLGPMTTYGVGGAAAGFIEVQDGDDLTELRAALAGKVISVFVIGRGSNLLVSDDGFDGLALRLGAGFNFVQLPGSRGNERQRVEEGEHPLVVRAGGATPLPVLARQVADGGWSGLAWSVGVPGSIGGAVRMNAGGHGSDMASCLYRYSWVDLFSGRGGTDDVAHLNYGYRSSSIGATELVVEAQLMVTPGEVEVEKEAVSSIVRWRRAHQPGGSNAGSVFTNPEGDSAGRLIEEAGLKGYRVGSAEVSGKHANFIQADKGGRAGDVRALMAHVQSVVLERCGVSLNPEVRLLGFAGGETGGVKREEVGEQ
jgi:UDP-N-acetylmuramate dehydrogenase